MPLKKWKVTKKTAGKQREGHVMIKSQLCLSLTQYAKGICLKITHILVESQHQLRGEMSKTPKRVYEASSIATSSCRYENGLNPGVKYLD